jgi:hypothetical protein
MGVHRIGSQSPFYDRDLRFAGAVSDLGGRSACSLGPERWPLYHADASIVPTNCHLIAII